MYCLTFRLPEQVAFEYFIPNIDSGDGGKVAVAEGADNKRQHSSSGPPLEREDDRIKGTSEVANKRSRLDDSGSKAIAKGAESP
ncbi:hypothetical protein EV182_006059 [Spiromyces aspiralis]|uniref:Uncharacterized protein n=1 Tax=Spiromyces aspiralis TaxID=68401 RepID=A0ACC1HT20_9FUNG|nr:hypothetical protein EV182_006059 [Spiromyces aspiralis]